MFIIVTIYAIFNIKRRSLFQDYNNMSKFLNRILGMPVELQNRLFKYFTDTLAAVMEQAKRSGRFDLGILDLGSAGESVRRSRTLRFLRRHATGQAPVELHTVHSEVHYTHAPHL
ncbi:unnamed protein product [Diatraea saccharalis]|uniref:Strawberry notch helicase C domain-containing protein n=1 Tax=Diatraea saccharalis TaxID=40085 RepID=A0A9N9R6G4_9NEOP|nr:unnamed protein product [Diatraea saccharalis]